MRKSQRQILRDSKLRSTTSRAVILGIFLQHSRALSNSDIEQATGESVDRVTLYRTLKTFVEHGILHKVLDDSGTLKYGLCDDRCSSATHHHDHVHFKCHLCGETNCLDIAIPGVALPSGFEAEEVNVLIQGTCARCH